MLTDGDNYQCGASTPGVKEASIPSPISRAGKNHLHELGASAHPLGWAHQLCRIQASKGGLMLMMQSLAQEVAEQQIRVNGIAPGAIKTPINEEEWSDPAKLEKLLDLIPYGRIGDPEDVAKAAI